MGALDGILVLALEQAVAAPVCTARLADAGARVIKIERPEGETARHYDSAVDGTCTYFAWLNQGKESAVLNLKGADDMALFRRMLARADVLVQNLVPGAMDRMGLGDAALRRDFPQLIAVRVCGYGADTGYAQMRAYDMLVQAEAAVCAVTGTPDVPSKVGVPVADLATGSAAHAAVLEALIARGRTGQGQAIEIAMFDTLADWMAVPLLLHEHAGTTVGREGLSHANVQPYKRYACADGDIVIAVQTNRHWGLLCREVLARPDLVEHPDFATNTLRSDSRLALDAVLEPLLAARTVAEMAQACTTAGIAWSRYRELSELPDHPALRRAEVKLEGGGTASVPRPAGRGPGFGGKALPGLGQHTEAIRREFGG